MIRERIKNREIAIKHIGIQLMIVDLRTKISIKKNVEIMWRIWVVLAVF